MGVQGEPRVRSASAPYCTIHGGLKIPSKELVALEEGVMAQFATHQGMLDTIRADLSTTVAVSKSLKHEWEQHQGTGRGEDTRRMKEEICRLTEGAQNLQDKVFQLEDVLVQVTEFLKGLNDKVDVGGSGRQEGGFASQGDLYTHMQMVKVALASFRQEMKGAPLNFGGHSFQGLESCIAWAQTYMPEATYQCIPGMFYGLCLIRESVLYKQDMREDNIQVHCIQRLPMQMAVVKSVITVVLSILEGPKTAALKDPKYDFGAMKMFAKWKPTNGLGRASARLKEGLEGSWQQIKGAVEMFLQASSAAKGVMLKMLAEIKIHTSAIFVTEILLYYDEILCKTGGDPPHTKEVKESCWAPVMKLLRTIIKEVHKVQRFAAEAVSFGTDLLAANGMFLYAAMEELGILREFSSCNWRNHPKFNQNIIRHLFKTCLP
jgi:hypothetical protein